MRILVDMDDVLENMGRALVESLDFMYGLDVEYDDVRSWDIAGYFPTLTKEQVFEPLDNPIFWRCIVEPIPRAREVLELLIEDGHEIYVVTASHPNTIQSKIPDFLFKHYPFITLDKVIITQNKQMIRGDVLIDDAPHNLIGGEYKGVLFNAPHNSSFDAESAGLVRAKNWSEIYSILTIMGGDME